MVPRPSETTRSLPFRQSSWPGPRNVAVALDAAERHLRVGTAAGMVSATTRSYLADGRCVGWYGPRVAGWKVAVDAENADAELPRFLAQRLGAAQFWSRWTRAECLCKLADVPMLTWWRRHGLDVPTDFSGSWRTLRLGDVVVTVAFAPLGQPPWTSDPGGHGQ